MIWYLSKVKYRAEIDGKPKMISEEYLLHCHSLTDLEATCYEVLKERIKSPDIDGLSKPHPADVYKMTDGPLNEAEGDFWFVKVLCDFGDHKSTDLHILNAADSKQACERVKKRLKPVGYDWEIIETKLKKSLVGIYDKNNSVWVTDFEKRMEDLSARGRVEINIKQMNIPFGQAPDDSDEELQPDPKAITALVVRGVVSVDAEDLDNGYDGRDEHLEPVRELEAGNVLQLNSGDDTHLEPAA